MAQFPVNTFTDLGGIQTVKSRVDFNPRDAIFALNGYFDVRGSFTKRLGGVKYNADPLTAGQGLYDFRTPALQRILIGSGGNIYEGNAGSPILIQSGLDPDAFLIFETFRERAFYVNGVDPLYSYDGTNVFQVGIDAPGVGPTATPQAVGGTLPSGTYQIAITFANDTDPDNFIESNPSPIVSTVVVGPTGSIDLSNIPVSADPEVTIREVYMSLADGADLFLVGTIPDNVTTIFTITAEPSTFAKALEFDHDPPPEGMIAIEQHRNRLFGIRDNILYWSKENQPWYWPQGQQDETVQNFIELEVFPNTALIRYFDVLLIFQDQDIFALSGTNEAEFRVDRIRSDIYRGAVSKRGVKVIENYCYIIGRNSVYRTDGINVWDVGHPLQEFFDQTSLVSEFNVNRFEVDSALIEYDEERSLMNVFVPTTGSTVNNIGFTMDIKSGRPDSSTQELSFDWSIYTGITTQSSTVVLEEGVYRWYRFDDNGYVFRMNTIPGDGAQITSMPTSATANTLTDTSQSITVDLHAGLSIFILDEFGGIAQKRKVVSNTADTWTIDAPWDTIPTTSDTYVVGGIEYFYQHFWDSYGAPTNSKRLRYIRPRIETTGNFPICIGFYFDFVQEKSYKKMIDISATTLWDVDLWDNALWDGFGVDDERIPVQDGLVHRWSSISFENNTAGQDLLYYGHDKIFKMKSSRRPNPRGLA